MIHGDAATVSGREIGGAQHDVLDVSTREPELTGKKIKVDSFARSFDGKQYLPDTAAVVFVRKWKLHDELQTAEKGVVHVLPQVCSENRQSLVLFHFLQQVRDFDVRVTIVRVAYFGTLAE